MSDQEQSPRIIVDSDWKAEAAREKERLAAQEAKEKAKAGGGSGGGESAASSQGFYELVNMLAMQAAIGLGGYQGPGGERIPPNHEAAKHHIDLLDVLTEKTRGNLTDEESRALQGVTHELRMQYVQMVGGDAPKPPQQPPAQ